MKDDMLQWTGESSDDELAGATVASSPPVSGSMVASRTPVTGSTIASRTPVVSPIRTTRDVWTERLPELDWSQPRAALEAIHTHLLNHAESNINWYLRRKGNKKGWATKLRLTAILMGVLAAITPAAVSIFPKEMLPWNLAPLATVFAALGGGCLALDKFFGFSSGWMRFMWTETELQSRLRAFQLSWEQERLRLNDTPLTPERTEALLKFMRAFALEVDTLVRLETRAWVEEFKGGLTSGEKSPEAPKTAAPLLPSGTMWGILRLRLEGTEGLDDRRWQVQLGPEPPKEHRGNVLVADDLRPGRLVVRVMAHRGGEPVSAEDVVVIKAGEQADLVIKLV